MMVSRCVTAPLSCTTTLLLIVLPLIYGQRSTDESETSFCYDATGKAQFCLPPFHNVAFKVPVEVTNTCGENGIIEFCQQAANSLNRNCERCYPPGSTEGQSYPASHLTDYDTQDNRTWWQSETMLENIQYPNQVNLTLYLQKTYDITFIQLTFKFLRPESFAIYKRVTEDGPWIPYHYFSSTCRGTYELPELAYNRAGNDSRAFCTSEFSAVTPLTGGVAQFATLKNRRSAFKFLETPELWEWVTARDIRITLNRLNTFGDELWKEPVVLKSYFYAIQDIAIGGRCKCNGHASRCLPVEENSLQRYCVCEHNTAGPDCGECLPFYNDLPWGRATHTDAHECRACNCNGFSNRCYFDKELYEQTRHGGHCLDCQGNRAGPNCERCKENFYQSEGTYCVDCHCNVIGSRSLQCNSEGKCQCKPGVTGDKCDRCDANHYDFGSDGCKPCNCEVAGSLGNAPHCDPYTGVCSCKENVEGRRCQNCKPGFFNLDEENTYGCTPCFCYGQASVCTFATGYSKVVTESSFARGNEKWSAEDITGRSTPLSYNPVSQNIGVNAPSNEPVYFVASNRFLGDQRASYNQDLEFKLRIGETAPSSTVEDVVLEGAGLAITQPIFGQSNPLPSTENQQYRFRLHEHGEHGWQPRLSARDFMSVLANLTAIKVRGTYVPRGVGFLDDFRLHTARRGAAGAPARWIETCTCPLGYVGQFCESCAHKYRHEPTNGGPFARCVPCNCNKHADSCEEDSGRCICQHNTEGENCERCARGYYGNSLAGTPDDCKPCPCPEGGACMELGDDQVICIECPKGYSGHRCDLCSDGYFGDPLGKLGPVTPCLPCDCNNNVDPNAVGNCNRTTGVCLKCIYNTGGSQCDQCLPGYYGDALAIPKGDCKPCQCYRSGTLKTDMGPPLCDQLTGRCHCKPFVIGANCDSCELGYYNITSGEGCQACNCNSVGSLNKTCNLATGQCYCRPGVTGKHCDVCEPYHYGFSAEGCKPCECDELRSTSLQCNADGQCPCLENVEGRRCDKCKENKYAHEKGCEDCPACYSLVQTAANDVRAQLAALEKVLNDIANSPTVINDEDFETKLNEVQARVEAVANDARYGIGVGGQNLPDRLLGLSTRLENLRSQLSRVDELKQNAQKSIEQGASNVSLAQEAVTRTRSQLDEVVDYLRTDGAQALQRALNRSQQFGQQNRQISEISQEARFLAQEHEKEANKIKEIAMQAENASSEAYNIIKDAVKWHRNTTEEITQLRNDVATMERKVDRVRALAEDAQNAATQTMKEALQVFQEIDNLPVTESPTARLKEEAESITKEAKRITEEVAELNKKHADSLQDLQNQLTSAEDLFARAQEQQFFTNQLLAEVDIAKNKAEEAVKLGQNSIKEAQETYRLLTEFEKGVQDSKDRAKQALENIPEINRLIDHATNKTQEARLALKNAEMNAQKALDNANEAQSNYAERASKEAHVIREEAESTKTKASSRKDEAYELANRVATTEILLNKLEAEAENDAKRIEEAKLKVGQIKASVTDAAKQVDNVAKNVSSILAELEGLSEIDEKALDDLEARLVEAESLVGQSGMEERVQFLKDEKIAQNDLFNRFQIEVEKLREEVAIIEKISDSLPEGCFKSKTMLEP